MHQSRCSYYWQWNIVKILKEVQSLINEAECDIPVVAIDRAHRNGNGCKDRKTNTLCKSTIVRFTTFRHRIMFYRNRNKLKNNAKVKLDLTRKRYMTFTRALESVKKVSIVDYVMVDINCRLKVVFKSDRSKFFNDDDSLNEAIEQERIQWNIGKELLFQGTLFVFYEDWPLVFNY